VPLIKGEPKVSVTKFKNRHIHVSPKQFWYHLNPNKNINYPDETVSYKILLHTYKSTNKLCTLLEEKEVPQSFVVYTHIES
jgi:hypothetical protein